MTKLSKETQEAVREIVCRTFYLEDHEEATEVRREGSGWKVEIVGASSWVAYVNPISNEHHATLQRAADETAGRVLAAQPMSNGKARAMAEWNEAWRKQQNDTQVAEAEPHGTGGGWTRLDHDTREEFIRQAKAEPSGKPHGRETTKTTVADLGHVYAAAVYGMDPGFWRRLKTDDSERRDRLRGTMEAMSNVMVCVYKASTEAEHEDHAMYLQGHHELRNPQSFNARARASERWSAAVRKGVAALQPKVRVWCQGDWED